MSVSKLKKQFLKEFKANPKKAAILGLLLLVAIYFWFPLAIDLFGKGSKSASKPVAKQESSSTAATSETPESGNSPSSPVPEKIPEGPPWDEVLKWKNKDPLTISCDKLKTEHDPFKRVEKIIEPIETDSPLAVNTEEAPVVEPPRDLSPTALGMQLTSTIVGSNRSVAMIDERAYALGHRVVAYDGSEKLRFELIDIRSDRVVLRRDNQEYVLKIKPTDALTVSVAEDPGL